MSMGNTLENIKGFIKYLAKKLKGHWILCFFNRTFTEKAGGNA